MERRAGWAPRDTHSSHRRARCFSTHYHTWGNGAAPHGPAGYRPGDPRCSPRTTPRQREAPPPGRALPPARPRSPHSPAAGRAPPPHGQRLTARRPRPGLWKEAGAAATASSPPPLRFTWPGSPRCPDCPHRRRASSDQGDGPLSEALARQPLHLSNSLRVWRWRPPS